MTTHELMIRFNHYLIKNVSSPVKSLLTESQKARITNQFLNSRSSANTVQRFKKGVNAPEYLFMFKQSEASRVMYPLFFIPPYNSGKKLQTVLPMSPKTQILSANSYELEILRLLHILAPENPTVQTMVKETIARLQTTCFAYHDCHHGECFHTALISLRFLGAVSNETSWIKNLINYFNKYNDESAKIHQPVLYCILRNCLTRFIEYSYLKNRLPYVNDKDGRLHFDTNRQDRTFHYYNTPPTR